MLCFVVVMQSFIMNSHEIFIDIHQGCFAGTGAIVRLPQCQWSKPDGYGKISQCITTTKHSKAKTVCIFLGIYCKSRWLLPRKLCFCHHIFILRKEDTISCTCFDFMLRLHFDFMLWFHMGYLVLSCMHSYEMFFVMNNEINELLLPMKYC